MDTKIDSPSSTLNVRTDNTPISKTIIHDELTGDCYDVLQGTNRYKANVYLIDCSPRLCPVGRTMEYSIVRSARISVNAGLKTPEQDEKLVRYLIKNKHTSPLETVRFTFKIKCPIFVARQIMRHRTFSYNEISARYSVIQESCFVPPVWKFNHPTNKQASGQEIEDQEELSDILKDSYIHSGKAYHELLKAGVSKELARLVLPVGTMTEFFMTGDLNNLLKFFELRCAEEAQEATRNIANAMRGLVTPLLPIVFDNLLKLQQRSKEQ